MKLVSVIIPCYKNSQTLGRAIKSVIAQTYPLIEIIVVNDCSPESEDIENVLLQYCEVLYIRNSANAGPASSRNKGLSSARGEIVAFLDADDEYHPKKIELQVAVLEPGAVVTCGILRMSLDGKVKERRSGSRIIDDPNYLIYRNTLNGAGLLASRDLLIQHGGYDGTLRACEDWDLYLRLLSAGIKVKDIGYSLYFYYASSCSLSSNHLSNNKWELEVIKRHSSRMNAKWKNSYRYPAMLTIFLLRHIMRGEISKDQNFRLKIRCEIKATYLLDNFIFIRFFLLLIAYLRLFFLVSLLPRYCADHP